MPRILIVDDDAHYRETYATYAKSLKTRPEGRTLDITVDLAASVQEGLKCVRENKYDAAIVDYSLNDGTGNDFAALVPYNLPMAGVTDGNIKRFDKKVFSIREAKQVITPDIFAKMVDCLLNDKNYHTEVENRQQYYTELTALNILLQGYVAAARKLEGLPPFDPSQMPVELQDTLLKNVTVESKRGILDLKSIGIDATKLYSRMHQYHPEMADEENVHYLFTSIIKGQQDLDFRRVEKAQNIIEKGLS